MKDIDIFIDILTRAGIQYERIKRGNFYADEDGSVHAIELTACTGNVHGYAGMVATFTFDKKTGALKNAYIWE